jgi:hypothetical protein
MSKLGVGLTRILPLCALLLLFPTMMLPSIAFAQQLTATITPTQGSPGTTVTGTGTIGANSAGVFIGHPGDRVQVRWDDASFTILANTTAGNDGTFSVSFNVPSNATAGAHSPPPPPPTASDTCLRAPLPINPGTPNYSVAHEVVGEKMSMVFWCEVCADGTGVALLMKATPLVGSPFLCNAAFTVIQNGVQHNYIDLEPAPGSNLGWCNDLLVPITLIVTDYQFVQPQFDPAQALTVIYDFIVAVRLDIP